VAVGMPVYLVDDEGQNIPGTITGVFADSVHVDINHPLAGKTLVFDIEIVEIES
jgi:FKBP-type peptidyl-prolyl cis-trans isomerase 2